MTGAWWCTFCAKNASSKKELSTHVANAHGRAVQARVEGGQPQRNLAGVSARHVATLASLHPISIDLTDSPDASPDAPEPAASQRQRRPPQPTEAQLTVDALAVSQRALEPQSAAVNSTQSQRGVGKQLAAEPVVPQQRCEVAAAAEAPIPLQLPGGAVELPLMVTATPGSSDGWQRLQKVCCNCDDAHMSAISKKQQRQSGNAVVFNEDAHETALLGAVELEGMPRVNRKYGTKSDKKSKEERDQLKVQIRANCFMAPLAAATHHIDSREHRPECPTMLPAALLQELRTCSLRKR